MEISPGWIYGGVACIVGVTTLATRLLDRGDGKRKVIYDRIEQERKDADDKYRTVKFCDERSTHITKNQQTMQTTLDTILTEVKKNGNPNQKTL